MPVLSFIHLFLIPQIFVTTLSQISCTSHFLPMRQILSGSLFSASPSISFTFISLGSLNWTQAEFCVYLYSHKLLYFPVISIFPLLGYKECKGSPEHHYDPNTQKVVGWDRVRGPCEWWGLGVVAEDRSWRGFLVIWRLGLYPASSQELGMGQAGEILSFKE